MRYAINTTQHWNHLREAGRATGDHFQIKQMNVFHSKLRVIYEYISLWIIKNRKWLEKKVRRHAAQLNQARNCASNSSKSVLGGVSNSSSNRKRERYFLIARNVQQYFRSHCMLPSHQKCVWKIILMMVVHSSSNTNHVLTNFIWIQAAHFETHVQPHGISWWVLFVGWKRMNFHDAVVITTSHHLFIKLEKVFGKLQKINQKLWVFLPFQKTPTKSARYFFFPFQHHAFLCHSHCPLPLPFRVLCEQLDHFRNYSLFDVDYDESTAHQRLLGQADIQCDEKFNGSQSFG